MLLLIHPHTIGFRIWLRLHTRFRAIPEADRQGWYSECLCLELEPARGKFSVCAVCRQDLAASSAGASVHWGHVLGFAGEPISRQPPRLRPLFHSQSAGVEMCEMQSPQTEFAGSRWR